MQKNYLKELFKRIYLIIVLNKNDKFIKILAAIEDYKTSKISKKNKIIINFNLKK
jgi:hypothetical protein